MHNKIVFICGRKGCGKTTLANDIAQAVYYRGQRVIVVAPMGGFQLPGAAVYRAGGSFSWQNVSGRSVLVMAENDFMAAETFVFAWEIQKNARRPLWLFVDEVDKYLPWRNPDPTLTQIIRYGRHRRLNLVGICQRPANVHNDLLAQADYRIVFNTSEPNDLAYLKKYCGVEADVVQGLDRFKYVRA